jgi:adenylate kinase
LSTGELLRDAQDQDTPLGRQAARFMRSGQLVPDDVVIGIVADRLTQEDCAAGCLFDGFPRTVPQAKTLDDLLLSRKMHLDLVLAIEVPQELLVDRLLARGRTDDNRETIRERFRQYDRLTEPLLDYYRGRGILRVIDGAGSPDDVFGRVRTAADAVVK